MSPVILDNCIIGHGTLDTCLFSKKAKNARISVKEHARLGRGSPNNTTAAVQFYVLYIYIYILT